AGRARRHGAGARGPGAGVVRALRAAGRAGVRADALPDVARRSARGQDRGRDPAGGVRGMGRVRIVPDSSRLTCMQVRTLRAGAAQLFADFFKLEAASGILLIGAAVIALVCANTPLNDLYQGLRELPVQLQIGTF